MKTLNARTLSCLLLITLVGIVQLQAQSPTPRVALRVNGLTSDERDLLSADLGHSGHLRISFACVPAGILILEPVSSERSADSVRAMATAALIRRLPAERRTEVALSQLEAEELCSAARAH